MPGMKRLICLVVLLLIIASGLIGFGRRKWRQYQTIERQMQAEQEYVERVKREAGE